MKKTLKIIFFLVNVLYSSFLFSQGFPHYFQSNNLKVSDSLGKIYLFPFAGGLKFPVFANYDLNGDGCEDLLILDRADSRLLTFLNAGVPGKDSFVYRPQFEALFPENISRYFYLKDYNSDGKPDLFTFAAEWNSGIAVYQNTGTLTQPVFKLVADQISAKYMSNPFETPIYVSSADIPSFEDIDHDGDLDMISFDVYTGGRDYVKYYRNMSEEYYGNNDSLKFVEADGCWGKFYEGDSSNSLTLRSSCPDIMVQIMSVIPRRHSGSTSLLLDYDADGDFDLLLGDVSFPSITLLINGKSEYSWRKDSMISQTHNFPVNTKAVSIRNMPAMFYIDVNNDGKRDLILSPMDESIIDTFENLNQVWLYINKGKDNAPDFEYKKNNFLQDEMVNPGGKTAPAFFDYDNDGDPDLFVATSGNYAKTGNKHDRIVLYENIGTASHPYFKLKNDDYLGLSKRGYKEISPAFGDVDGDGDRDLIIGNGNGRLSWYKNIASSGQKAEFVFVTDFFDSIDVGFNAVPYLYSFSHNHFDDLLIGNKNGNISYYRNKQVNGSAEFVFVTDTFGSIKVDNARFSAAVVYDMDGNGKEDLLFSYNIWDTYFTKELGKILFFKDIDTNSAVTFKSQQFPLYDSVNKKLVTATAGLTLRLAVAQLGNDLYPDIIAGNERGGLLFFSTEFDSLNTGISPQKTVASHEITSFPNPFNNYINININGLQTQKYLFQITDISGKVLVSRNIFTGKNSIETNNLPDGIYIIFVKNNENELLYHEKIIKH